MGSNGREAKSDKELSEVLLDAECLTRLLTINTPAPSDPIVRKLSFHEIQNMQHLVTPDDHPRDLPSVLQEATTVFDNRMRLAHPHCFSYMPACPNWLARLGDLLTSLYNINAASWDVSSGPSAVEKAIIVWLGAQLGLPDSVGGCFVSGRSMANMTAIFAARDEILHPIQRANAVIYISDQTHISILKALDITGFMEDQVQKIPTDDNFRIDVDILQRTITTDRQSGRVPFLLVANCGSTNTGSIDPLHALADLARDEGYGCMWMTYDCGIVLTRHVGALRRSFAVDAEYISSTLAPQGTTNFYNLGPELSRPARAMSLWLTVRALGRRQMGEMIDHAFLLARTADYNIRQYKNWIVAAPTVASIVVFRYAPPGFSEQELDTLNMAVSQRLLTENIAAILTTKIRGRTTLRMCTMNPLVKPETIDDVIRQVDRLASSEASELRKTYSKMAKIPYTHCQEFSGVDVLQHVN